MAACSFIVPPAQSRLPMTTPTERAQVYFANARLPATLPTPPRSKMLPLLPTPPCLGLLPTSPPKPTPSRADADERWDARKNCSLSAAPGRADERWDRNKKSATSSSSSSTSSNNRASSSSFKWNGSNKKQTIISRADAVRRWDEQKKKHDRELHDDRSSTRSNDVELATPRPRKHAFYAGPGFSIVSPDPGMLPMPSFMVRVA